MDRFEVRETIDDCFKRNDKHTLLKILSFDDLPGIVNILWEKMEDYGFYKHELDELKDKIKALNNKSGLRVRCIKSLPDRKALVQLGPFVEEIVVSPSVDVSKLNAGVEVLVIGSSDGRVLAEIKGHDICDGRISKIHRILDPKRVVINDGNYESILKVADWVICKEGDEVRYDIESQMVLEVLSKNEKIDFALETVPNISFDDVKGLEEEKKYLQERLIYPIVYREKFKKYGIKPIRAALFHGAPGCGKTYLAKAIFNEMFKLRGESVNNKGFFLINGPSVLSKWAGNTEAAIRKIFSDARKTAEITGFPSIIFWDEIESITGKRKDSSTYTPEKTVVPTLLAELQGVDDNNNVVLIGATNMPQLIDPALMRPGRLGDAILEIPRPGKEAAAEIMGAEFSRGIPEKLQILIDNGLKEKIVSHIFDNPTPLAVATTKNGTIMPLMRQEQVSGALFTQIGEELVRSTCISEIMGTESITLDGATELAENIMLNQIGVLDAGVKSGFTFNTEDYVIDISLNA
jgi:proteasome-associated ATPase